MSGSAEAALEHALEREWRMQGAAREGLQITQAVREACELAAGVGALEVAARLDGDVSSPERVLDRMRPLLPAELDSWAARLLARLADEPVLQPAAPLPAPPAPVLPVLPVAPAAPPPALPSDPRRPRPVLLVGGVSAAAGVLLGLLLRRRRRR